MSKPPVLVRERWGGIEVAADEADQSEQHDRPAAVEHEEDAHKQRKDKSRPGDRERTALADAALENRHRHSRRRDRVDAVPNVIDLIDDVGPDMQAEATEQGGDEERPVHATLAERDRAADRDRQYRGREAERPDDLPHSPCTAGAGRPPLSPPPIRSKIKARGHPPTTP